ncbi:hypothetical protein [Rhizobium rhizoryzae]|uniref:hypothetical protein n=1 Tax=Rhizobium rhizoryzae TaxID=451876 RepID=UPI00289BF182|nr:hypothetical protein [Rhizobium rhizoryzae]
MIGLIDGLKIGAGAAGGFLVALALSVTAWQPSAKREAIASERAAQLAKFISIIQKRTKTDAAVSKLDNRFLCLELGGLPDECDRY